MEKERLESIYVDMRNLVEGARRLLDQLDMRLQDFYAELRTPDEKREDHRSSVTGRYVEEEEAEANPDTTQKETR